jgi:hypothetical protein
MTFKKILFNLLEYILVLLEKYEYRNLNLNCHDDSKKIIESIENEVFVRNESGLKQVSHIHKTQPYKIWEIETYDGLKLKCADNHILIDNNGNEIFTKDLKINSKIKTVNGISRIIRKEKRDNSISMYDLSMLDQNEPFYYTNGILSHNTITSGIFILWYLIYNQDKNSLILANKGATMQEIIDKIKIIYEHLPYFLKPGVNSWGATFIKFDNKCRLFGQATTATPGLGFTIHMLYADEFAHIPPNIVDAFWRSVYPTLSSSTVSRFIVTSTANGLNKFYQIYSDALKKLNNFKAIRVDWQEVPGRDEEWKKSEIANLGSLAAFNQEYGNQFLTEDKLLLPLDTVLWCRRIQKPFIFKRLPELDECSVDYSKIVWKEDFNVSTIPDNYFILSVDFAEGIGSDYTVVNIFQVEKMSKSKISKKRKNTNIKDFLRLRQVGYFRDNESPLDDFAKVFYEMIYELFDLDKLKIIFEVNDKRYLILENELIKSDKYYEDAFVKTAHSIDAKRKKIGILLSKTNRSLYFTALRDRVARKNVILQDETTVKELENFGLSKRGTFKSQTGHDDLGMTCVNLMSFFYEDDYKYFINDFFEEKLKYEEQEEILLAMDSQIRTNKDDDYLDMINDINF